MKKTQITIGAILTSVIAIIVIGANLYNFQKLVQAKSTLKYLSNPIFLEKMTYGSSKKQEKINGLYIVPVSLSFQGTDKNFYKIIEYLESSGNLENESRLLEITKIAINWEGKEFEKSDIELYDF